MNWSVISPIQDIKRFNILPGDHVTSYLGVSEAGSGRWIIIPFNSLSLTESLPYTRELFHIYWCISLCHVYTIFDRKQGASGSENRHSLLIEHPGASTSCPNFHGLLQWGPDVQLGVQWGCTTERNSEIIRLVTDIEQLTYQPIVLYAHACNREKEKPHLYIEGKGRGWGERR